MSLSKLGELTHWVWAYLAINILSVEVVALRRWTGDATCIVEHARLTTLGGQQELNFGNDLAGVICVFAAVPDLFEFIFFVDLMVSDREFMRVFVPLVADDATDGLTLLLSPKNLGGQASKYATSLLSFRTSLVWAARLLRSTFVFIFSVRDIEAINTEPDRLRF